MTKTIYIIYNGRFPGEKAASLFVAKSAEAFADQNCNVIAVVPRRLKRIKVDFNTYYHTKNNFRVVYLPTIDLFLIPIFKKFSFFTNFISFSLATFFYLLFVAKKTDIIYSNETLPLIMGTYICSNAIYELHDFPEKKKLFYSFLFSRVRLILVTNKWKIQKVNQLFEFTKDKTFYEPNAVDLTEFNINLSKEEAREKLQLSSDKKIVVYTGHLYSWKGVDTLAETAKLLPNYLFVFVGGTKEDITSFKLKNSNLKNITIIGQRPHQEIPLWQKAADVLVLPNTAKEDISKYYTSPMKLFEYMASQRSIVASDIPSIREIVSNEDVFLVEPDNADALAEGIKQAIENSQSRELQAFKKVENHSWEARSKRILQKIL